MMTQTAHPTQPPTHHPVITLDTATCRLLSLIDTDRVLRHPRTDSVGVQTGWTVTINGRQDTATGVARRMLTELEDAGLIGWWRWHGKWAATGTQKAHTTPLGNRTLQDWDRTLGLITSAPTSRVDDAPRARPWGTE